jgi:PIN domain nuclease of toxin-antitoxin system
VKLLLDTHVWIWTQEAVEKLGPETEALLVDPRSTLVVSPISTLEIARLLALGGLRLKGRLETWVNDTLAALSAQTQEVSHQIARGVHLARAIPPGSR